MSDLDAVVERVTVVFPLGRADLTAVLAARWEDKPRGRLSRERVLKMAAEAYESDGLQFEWEDKIGFDSTDKAWDWAAKHIARLWP